MVIHQNLIVSKNIKFNSYPSKSNEWSMVSIT